MKKIETLNIELKNFKEMEIKLESQSPRKEPIEKLENLARYLQNELDILNKNYDILKNENNEFKLTIIKYKTNNENLEKNIEEYKNN